MRHLHMYTHTPVTVYVHVFSICQPTWQFMLCIGQFAGFDETLPTCDSDGKPRVVEKLRADFGYKKIVHIGDGATDMLACPPAVSDVC